VETIRDAAFCDCESLQNVIIGESVYRLEDNVFKGCSNLTNVTILPGAITQISCSMFADCKNLKEITIPKGVKTIDNYAFSGCSELESITLPTGVGKIGEHAFNECTKLRAIYVPAKKTDYYNVRLKVQLWKYIVELAPVKKAKKK
jgi:hypothetical protein